MQAAASVSEAALSRHGFQVPCYFHSAHTAAGGARELGCRLPDLFQLIFKRRLEKCGAIVSHPQGFSQPGTPNSTSLLS